MPETWAKFQAALQAADGWFSKKDPVPARPLQGAADHPKDYEMTRRPDEKANEEPEVCKYCDYDLLCGQRRLR
jgi:ATP-dependent helicase/nuclease subunit B